MGPEPNRLHDSPDRAGFDQIPRADGGAVLEPLAVHDRVDPLGGRLDLPDLRQLRERRDARLVGHVIFAVIHHANADRPALVGNRRAQHELDGLVLQDLGFALRRLGHGELLDEGRAEVRLLGIHGHQFAPAPQDRARHAVDVPVVDADDRELDAGRHVPPHRRRLLGHRIGPRHLGGFHRRHRRQQRHGRRRTGHVADERTPIDSVTHHGHRPQSCWIGEFRSGSEIPGFRGSLQVSKSQVSKSHTPTVSTVPHAVDRHRPSPPQW